MTQNIELNNPKPQMVGHFTVAEYKDIEETIIRNLKTPDNHVVKTALSLLTELNPPNKGSSHLIDIGAGPGLMCASLADRFSTVTALDINPEYESFYRLEIQRHSNFRYVFGDFREVTFTKKYTHLLSSHMMYYTPQADWPKFILKILSILEPQGQALIILEAPQGRFHEDLCVKINPKGAHSGVLKIALYSLGIDFSSSIIKTTYVEKNREKFKEMVRMFAFDNCYIRSDYEALPESKKAQDEALLDKFVDESFDPENTVFSIQQESEHIVITNDLPLSKL
jgi:ubiquinone/menaquinone biosynthesis C-methylase UbiE